MSNLFNFIRKLFWGTALEREFCMHKLTLWFWGAEMERIRKQQMRNDRDRYMFLDMSHV